MKNRKKSESTGGRSSINGEVLSHDRLPHRTYIIIHVCTIALSKRYRTAYASPSSDYTTKIFLRLPTPYIVVQWHFTDEGWSSDFPPLPSAFSSKYSMAFMLRNHNGVHCCGTVGDSHPSSQLSTAKCTFKGDSFQNHGAKVRKKIQIDIRFFKKNLE